MRITPLISADIVGRYSKKANCIIDNFTNTIIQTPSKNKRNKLYCRLNTIGLLNSNRLQNNQAMISIVV